MKNIFKKFFRLLLPIILMSSFIFTSCKEKIPPTESAIAYFNLYGKGIQVENLPFDDNEIEKSMKDSKYLTINYIKMELESLNFGEIPKKTLNKAYNDILEISKYINPKAEEISKKDDVAVIKLTSKPIDLNSYEQFLNKKSNEIYNTILESISEKDLIAISNFTDKEIEEYILNIIKEQNIFSSLVEDLFTEIKTNPIYSKEEYSVEITLKKMNGSWIIDSQKQLRKFDKLIFKDFKNIKEYGQKPFNKN